MPNRIDKRNNRAKTLLNKKYMQDKTTVTRQKSTSGNHFNTKYRRLKVSDVISAAKDAFPELRMVQVASSELTKLFKHCSRRASV